MTPGTRSPDPRRATSPGRSRAQRGTHEPVYNAIHHRDDALRAGPPAGRDWSAAGGATSTTTELPRRMRRWPKKWVLFASEMDAEKAGYRRVGIAGRSVGMQIGGGKGQTGAHFHGRVGQKARRTSLSVYFDSFSGLLYFIRLGPLLRNRHRAGSKENAGFPFSANLRRTSAISCQFLTATCSRRR